MENEIVSYFGMYAKIEHEHYGIAQIKLLKNNQRKTVWLLELKPTNFKIIK